MTGTTNLDIQLMSDGNDSVDRAGFFKDAQDDMDAILTEDLSVYVDGTNAASIATADWRRNVFFRLLPNGISAQATMTVPSVKRGVFIVINSTGFAALVETAAQVQPTPSVKANSWALLTCDGTDVLDGQPVQTYEVAKSVMGELDDGATILRHLIAERVTFEAGLPDSLAIAMVAATAQTDIDIRKNDVSVGTIRFAAAADDATFIFAGDVTFEIDDIMTWVAPSPPDATLAGLIGTLTARRL